MQVVIPWLAFGLLVAAVCRARLLSLLFLIGLLAALWGNFAQPSRPPGSSRVQADSRHSWIKQLSDTEALLDLGDGRRVLLSAPGANVTPALAGNAVLALRAQEQATGQVEVAPGEAFHWGGVTLTYAASGEENRTDETDLLERAKQPWPLLLVLIGVGCIAWFARRAVTRLRVARTVREEEALAKQRAAHEVQEREAHEAAFAMEMRKAQEEAEREALRARDEQQASESLDPKSPTWWEILGVPPSASWPDVQRTYRAKIQQYHPDRVHGMGPEIVRVAEHITAELNRARAEAEADHRSNAAAPTDEREEFASH